MPAARATNTMTCQTTGPVYSVRGRRFGTVARACAIGTRISENHQNVTVFQGSVVMLQPPFPVSAAAVNTSVPSVLRPVLACPDASVAPDQPAVTFKADMPGQTWLTTYTRPCRPMPLGYGLPVGSFDATVTVVPDPRPFVAVVVILLLVGFGVLRHVRGRGRRPGHLPGAG
jgi:hypothetical protein